MARRGKGKSKAKSKGRRGNQRQQHGGSKAAALPVEPIARAKALIAAGKPDQAEVVLAGLASKDPDVKRLRRQIADGQLRKAQRQNRVEVLQAANKPALRLAVARMQGPAALAELAAGSDGDAALAAAATAGSGKAALQVLRRRARALGGAAGERIEALAAAWMLVLRQEWSRAQAAFTALAATDPWRARLGLAVIASQTGQAIEARQQWQGLGPFPATATPQASAFGRQLERQIGTDPAALLDVLRHGDEAELKRCEALCTGPSKSLRAWLRLVRGDRHYVRDSDAAMRLWREAANLGSEVAIDVAKRRLRYQIDCDEPGSALCDLYDLVRKREGESVAAQVVDALAPSLSGYAILDLQHSRLLPITVPGPRVPPCWGRVWLQRGFRRRLVGDPKALPASVRDLDPLLKRLDAAYGDESAYLDLLMKVMAYYRAFARLRTLCVRALRTDPTRADQLLARYACCASQDQRGGRKTLAELRELESLFPDRLLIYRIWLMVRRSDADTEAMLDRLGDHCGASARAYIEWFMARDGQLQTEWFGADPQLDALLLFDSVLFEAVDHVQSQAILDRIATGGRLRSVLSRCGELTIPQTIIRVLGQWQSQPAWMADYLILTYIAEDLPRSAITDGLHDLEDDRGCYWQDVVDETIAKMPTDCPEMATLTRLRDHFAEAEFHESEDAGDEEIAAMIDDIGPEALMDLLVSQGLPDPRAGGPMPSMADIEEAMHAALAGGALPGPDATGLPPGPPLSAVPQVSPYGFVVPDYWDALSDSQQDELDTALIAIGAAIQQQGGLTDSMITTLPPTVRQVLPGFIAAVIREATMFDRQVQEDPALHALVGLRPAVLHQLCQET